MHPPSRVCVWCLQAKPGVPPAVKEAVTGARGLDVEPQVPPVPASASEKEALQGFASAVEQVGL